ncbi:MAG: M16 family metallopeptidase, partial [Candidatus Xenobia bacterium]
DEVESQAGCSHFLEHMVFKGTPTRPVGRIAQEIHALGGYMNAFTTYECTCYWIVLPSRYFNTALDIQVDALRHSLFDPDEIRRESAVILEEMRMYQDRPESYCYEQLMGLVFPTHPYGRPVIGYESVVAGMDRPRLAGYYEHFYRPSNLAVVVVGDVETASVLERVQAMLGDLPGGPVTRPPLPVETDQGGMRRRDLQGDIHSGHLHVGFRVPGLFSEDLYACEILSSVLGEGRSSRLFRELRERRSMVNYIGTGVAAERDYGVLMVEATHTSGRQDEILHEVFREITALAQQGITERELQKARNMVEATYVFSQETVEGQARKLGYFEMMGDCTLSERYVEKLYQVTAEDVQRAAGRYLNPEQANIVSYQPA